MSGIEMVCLHCLDKPVHAHPPNDSGVVLFDLDSTLCDISGRMHLAPEKHEGSFEEQEAAWDKFHLACITDRLVESVGDLVKVYYFTGPVHLISAGRSHKYWRQTLNWLAQREVRVDALVLRPVGDDDLLGFKARYVRELAEKGISVRLAVDDDPLVVARYQEVGVPTLHVSPDTESFRLGEPERVAG